MMLFFRPRRFHLVAAMALPALLAGCADNKPPASYPPLRYDYLGQLNLNTSSLTIEDKTQSHPVDGNIGYKSPVPPIQAVRQMAEDRLVARGAAGSGTVARFVIDRAYILHEPGGDLNGQVAVHLDIIGPGGERVGYASAQAGQTLHPDPSQDTESPGNLYNVTRDMMQTLNVEFEYQVRHALGKWLVDAGGTPVGDAIQTQNLTGKESASTLAGVNPDADPATTVPANAPTTPTTPAAAATTPSEPNPIFPAGEDSGQASSSTASKVHTMSPPSSFLKLPGSSK